MPTDLEYKKLKLNPLKHKDWELEDILVPDNPSKMPCVSFLEKYSNQLKDKIIPYLIS